MDIVYEIKNGISWNIYFAFLASKFGGLTGPYPRNWKDGYFTIMLFRINLVNWVNAELLFQTIRNKELFGITIVAVDDAVH